MAYGIVKVDNITFDNGGSDQNVTVSGLYRATTSGVTVSGTIAATTVSGVTIIGSTTVSGATVTGTTANFTSGNFSNIISSAATMSGALIMASQQQVRFRELDNTNHIALQAPEIVSADQTITLPDQTGTVVTTGDNGSVTSTMILDGTILNANISASAAIADTKLATISTAGKVSGTAITSGTIATSGELRITNNTPAVSLTESDGTATHSQSLLVRSNNQFIIQTRNSAGVTLSNDYSIPANASGATDHIWRIANTEKARLNSAGLTVVNDLTISDKIIHAGDTNTAIRFPAADTVTVETNGSERARIDSNGRLLVGTSTNSAVSTLVLQGNSTSSVGASFLFLQRGVSVPGTNDSLGVLTFGNNASNLGAQILSSRDGGTWTSGTSHPGRLLFFTTADGNSSPTERMRITSAGNVGIGTIAGTGKLEVAVSGNRTIGNQWDNKSILIGTPGAFSGNLGLSFDTTNGATIESAAPGVASYPVRIAGSEIQLFTASTERVRIDSSGRLLVGTSTSVVDTFGASSIQVSTTDGNAASFSRYSADSFTPIAYFRKSRGALNTQGLVSSGDTIGALIFTGSDGTGFIQGATIVAQVDGTPGANDMPGRLMFSTTADGSASPTERMRITKDGGFMVGQTVTVAPGYGNGTVGAGFSNTDKVLYVSSSNPALRLNRNSDGSIVDFRRSGSAGVVGTISVTTTATAYNTSSDYRLKENVVPLDGAIARLNQLPVHRFNFIADPDTVVDGFIAHEAQAVVPECVTGEKDAVDDDGNPVYQGIDQSKLVPLLTAALQEAVAKIESLEARLTAAGL
jgi:hypothetical protein